MKHTITYSPEDLVKLVESDIERRGMRSTNRPKVDVSMTSVGYGAGEHDEPTLIGIVVEVDDSDVNI